MFVVLEQTGGWLSTGLPGSTVGVYGEERVKTREEIQPVDFLLSIDFWM